MGLQGASISDCIMHFAAIAWKVSLPNPKQRDGNSNSHGARPVHLIIKMIRWIRTSRLSIKNSLSLAGAGTNFNAGEWDAHREVTPPRENLY